MNYKEIFHNAFVNKKRQYNINKVWTPNILENRGFKIGDIVYHVNKEEKILTEFQIVVEKINTEYKIVDGFSEYCTPIERVTLKPLNGDWTSDGYFAMWFNMCIEFPFELITKHSKEIEKLKEVWTCDFKRSDILWSKY